MKFIRQIWAYVVLILLLATIGWITYDHDAIMDWMVLRNYQAPGAIQTLASDDTLTPFAQRLFYVNRPQIEGKDDFNKHCTNASDQIIVLGCYTGNRRGIYLYNVTDSRLAGIEQVTAAHEMLHQAYDRLSRSQRSKVDDLLQKYYASGTTDEIRSQMASYQKTEPGEQLNELHSVLGTEVSRLPAELETYYKQYFANRQKVTSYYEQYQAEFTERQKQIEDYDDQLGTLKAQIDVKRNDLSDKEKSLAAQRQQLGTYLSNNQINQYNAAVPGFNAQVNAYRTELDAANALIVEYNQLLEQRNAIAVQEQQLQQALDSHVSSAGTH